MEDFILISLDLSSESITFQLNMETKIIVLLDESGSMSNKKNDVIGGYNKFVSDQKMIMNDMDKFCLVKFNTVSNIIHENIPLNDVPNLTDETFSPNGLTALYDAIKQGIYLINRNKSKEERIIFLIMTDGEENSSRNATKQEIKRLISMYEREDNWTFIYIGENPDNWSKETGMNVSNSEQWAHDGPQRSFNLASSALSSIRLSNDKKSNNVFNSK